MQCLFAISAWQSGRPWRQLLGTVILFLAGCAILSHTKKTEDSAKSVAERFSVLNRFDAVTCTIQVEVAQNLRRGQPLSRLAVMDVLEGQMIPWQMSREGCFIAAPSAAAKTAWSDEQKEHLKSLHHQLKAAGCVIFQAFYFRSPLDEWITKRTAVLNEGEDLVWRNPKSKAEIRYIAKTHVFTTSASSSGDSSISAGYLEVAPYGLLPTWGQIQVPDGRLDVSDIQYAAINDLPVPAAFFLRLAKVKAKSNAKGLAETAPDSLMHAKVSSCFVRRKSLPPPKDFEGI